MDRTEYLAEYCASIDCRSKKLEDCDLCMYNKGRADMLDSIIRAEKNKYYCVEDLCDESKNCSDCMVKYLEQLKETKDCNKTLIHFDGFSWVKKEQQK